MSGLKGWALLLVLAVPFGLYVAWQANGLARHDLVSEPPPDRGAPKEQLAAARTKAAAWATDSRKAVGVAWQYRAERPDDATPASPDAAAVVKASAARSVELFALDQFLTGVERTNFVGSKLEGMYDKWKGDATLAGKDEQIVKEWLRKPHLIDSRAKARGAMEEADALIKKYSGSKFADKAKSGQWRLEARLVVIDALTDHAKGQYDEALKLPLPFPAGTNAAQTALQTLAELGIQIGALDTDLRRTLDDKMPVEVRVRAAIEAKGTAGVEFGARAKLLGLFAQDDLFTNPTGAGAWLRDVADQYARTQDAEARKQTRKKVQEFCDEFIPAAVQLDHDVLFKGKRVPRKEITVEYEPVVGGKVEVARLSDTTDGLTEFNLAARHAGKNTEVRHPSSTPGAPADLKPTDLSTAADTFNTERAKIAGIIGTKWTVNSVEELKKTCVKESELVNRLKKPGTGIAGPELKIAKRLDSLADGLKAAGALIDRGP